MRFEKKHFFFGAYTDNRKQTNRESIMITKACTVGIGVTAFGCGILVAFFLPETVLIVLEAGVIITAGILFSKS